MRGDDNRPGAVRPVRPGARPPDQPRVWVGALHPGASLRLVLPGGATLTSKATSFRVFGHAARYRGDRVGSFRTSELQSEPHARLRASRVETREPPGLEDRGVVSARRNEVPLREVEDEIVPQEVVDRPEGLHAELVRRVDGDSEDRHDAATAVEGEAGEREERLPVADLVAEGGGVRCLPEPRRRR